MPRARIATGEQGGEPVTRVILHRVRTPAFRNRAGTVRRIIPDDGRVAGIRGAFQGTLAAETQGERRDSTEKEGTPMPLGLTMEEIQLMIAEAPETTPAI